MHLWRTCLRIKTEIMNTTENNILLAEFVGGKRKHQTTIPIKENEIWLPNFGVCSLVNNGKKLKFDSDWNWLMVVLSRLN